MVIKLTEQTLLKPSTEISEMRHISKNLYNVDDWDKELRKRKTEATRSSYKSQLRMVLSDLQMTVEEFVAFARDEIPFHEKMKDYFEELPLAPLTLNVRIAAVQSFLKFINIKFDSSVVEADRSSTVQGIFDVEIPSQKNLGEILKNADIRARAAIALLGFCGLRPMLATQVCVKDIVDCEIIDGRIKFTKLPARINISRHYPGNKAKLDFFVFLTEQGTEYIAAWLNKRGEINGNTKILGVKKRAVQNWVNKTFEKSDFQSNVYILRSFCDNALGNLESYKRSFYMGHTGDLHTRYIMRKKLSPERIDELRAEFERVVEPRLGTPYRSTSDFIPVSALRR
ncbi:hypothetical protein ES703_91732 [subsurface metagenome]